MLQNCLSKISKKLSRIVKFKKNKKFQSTLLDSSKCVQGSTNSFATGTDSYLIPTTQVIPRFLFQFALWTGLLSAYGVNVYQQIACSIFHILMYTVIVDTCFTYIKGMANFSMVKMMSAYLISCILPVVSYHILRRRNKQIVLLLQNLEQFSGTSYKSKGRVIVMIIIFGMPFLFSTAVTTACMTSVYRKVYLYGYDRADPFYLFLLGLKFFLHFLMHPTLNTVLTLLYCTLCLRCRVFVRILKNEVVKCSFERFNASKQLQILHQKEKLDSILESLERIFSLPSLLTITTSFLSCSSILGSSVLHNEVDFNLMIQWLFYTIYHFGCLITTFWVAGGLPMELKEFKDAYYKKSCLRMIKAGIPQEPRLERWIFDKPDFVLTGYSILSYTRSTLLAVVGALLTYTLLVIS